MATPKKLKHLREALRALPGWCLERVTGGQHYLLRHTETNATVTMACSPSDHRYLRNTIKHAHQAIREAQERRA